MTTLTTWPTAKNRRARKRSAVLLPIAVWLLWILACGNSSPEVTLSGSVQFTGSAFTITNTGADTWTDVELFVNSDYSHKVGRLSSGQAISVKAIDVTKRDGTRFNPLQVKPQTAMVTAILPNGQRGYYSGSWK